jgi:Pectate lyase superfamily protein
MQPIRSKRDAICRFAVLAMCACTGAVSGPDGAISASDAGQLLDAGNTVFEPDADLKDSGVFEPDASVPLDAGIESDAGTRNDAGQDAGPAVERDESDGTNYEIPANAGAINVRDYGAKGDGVTDDTAAFAKAIDTNFTYCGGAPNNFRFVYVPNGVYLVTNQIYFQRWLVFQGQSEGGTIIKLKDGSAGFQNRAAPKALLRTRFAGNACSPSDGDNNSSFSNYIQNLTVDIGAKNPGAIGVAYNNHNAGAMRNVTIKAIDEGFIGLDLAETEFGPGLLKSITIDHFATGISTPGNVSHGTFEHITVKNCGLAMANFLPVSVHDFTSVNNQRGVFNGAGSALAHLVLVGGQFTTNAKDAGLAIENTNLGTVYLRTISQTGHSGVLSDRGNLTPGATLSQAITGEKHQVFPNANAPFFLPIKNPPPVFEEPSSQWVFVDPAADDDTATVQSAIDSGAQTIYFSFTGKYSIGGTIIVRKNVRRILGFNAVLGSQSNPIWRFENTLPVTVEFLQSNSFPNKKRHVEFANSGPVFWKSSDTYLGSMDNTATATGDLFFEDVYQDKHFMFPQNVWMRHWNPENNPATLNSPRVYGSHNGGTWWILGMKTEGIATHIETTGGGKTELLGGFSRDFVPDITVPFFRTVDSCLSASFLTYDYQGCGNSRALYGLETQAGVVKELRLTPCARTVGLYSGCAP